MQLPAPADRDILHFTHVGNLPAILDQGRLLADSAVGDHLRREVGDRDIKDDRRRLVVTCGPGGHPCDYVPFYFAPRSPMLYRIARGGVSHYQDGQDPLVYLRSTIGAALHSGRPWVFSNGNCGAHLTEYFDDLRELDGRIDWPLQYARMWSMTAEDPSRPTRRAAEFLVHTWMPWSHVLQVVVRTPTMATHVQGVLADAGAERPVVVRPEWYYVGAKFR
ncbi:DUF4433 domain-containing protein [Pseudonocardia tropica]|uniref:DUF4433 domain-containing protein n=1 Tax=Pseudonocardia tropica TaxID=681289 RepID=A0ABV1JVR8_9PSEU